MTLSLSPTVSPAQVPGLPHRAGLGLKTEHLQEVLETRPDIGFFEVHAENYMVAGGPFHHHLGLIRERYPLGEPDGTGGSHGQLRPVFPWVQTGGRRRSGFSLREKCRGLADRSDLYRGLSFSVVRIA